MSGKEATVCVVRCSDVARCAKVYKETTQLSVPQAVVYQETWLSRLLEVTDAHTDKVSIYM